MSNVDYRPMSNNGIVPTTTLDMAAAKG